MRILSTLNEIDPPVIPPLKKVERYQEEEKEWQVCRENPKYEVNHKGQWRTRDYQPEFPMAGTPWPFPKSKSIPLEEAPVARQKGFPSLAELLDGKFQFIDGAKMGATVTIRRPPRFLSAIRAPWELTIPGPRVMDEKMNTAVVPNEEWDGTYRHFKTLRQAGKM